MKNFILIILSFIFIISCNNGKKEKKTITYKELKKLLAFNKLKNINLSYYELNNSNQLPTLLDRFCYDNYFCDIISGKCEQRNKDKIHILIKNGAKYFRELKAYDNISLMEKIRYEINYNPLYKYSMIKDVILNEDSLDKILSAIISFKKINLLKIFIKENYNFNKTVTDLVQGNLSIFDIWEEKVTFLDLSIDIGNKEIISLLRQHGAKRLCDILKTNCKPLSPEIEKILNGDK